MDEKKFPQILPYGIKKKQGEEFELIREFTLRKVDGVFEQIYTHKKYAAKHPQLWMGKCVTAILESVGDVDIRRAFAKSEFKDIPEILSDMTLHDMAYVLMLGHIHTYGTQLDEVKFECSSCTHEGTFKMSLDTLKLADFVNEPMSQELVANLTDGWAWEVKDKPTKMMKRIHFRTPLFKDAAACEKYYSAKDIAEFNLRIAQSAITKVCAGVQVKNPETGEVTFEDGLELPADDLSMFRRDLILKLEGADRRDIRRAFNESNMLRLEVERECPRCDADMKIDIGVESLYPLA